MKREAEMRFVTIVLPLYLLFSSGFGGGVPIVVEK
jgi:hypothetical protein